MNWEELRKRGKAQAPEEIEKLAYLVIGAAIEVHRILGPGHLESAYRDALCYELELRGISARREVPYDLTYKGRKVGTGRLDLLVDGKLILELKACDGLSAVHTAQAISYLRCMNLPLTLLINFNVVLLQDGIRRVIYSPP
jgi:GxxExxY protein